VSVYPTDHTPRAIASVADEVVAYRVPVRPTTMSAIAYRGGKATIGVSSKLIHYPRKTYST